MEENKIKKDYSSVESRLEFITLHLMKCEVEKQMEHNKRFDNTKKYNQLQNMYITLLSRVDKYIMEFLQNDGEED